MSLTLIGMSGVGKSYVGKRVAKKKGFTFIDIDTEMERLFGRPLHELLEEWGDERFIREESAAVIAMTTGASESVFSPGGSVIYSPEAMEHLRSISHVLYLSAPPEIIAGRVSGDAAREGRIVGLKDRTLSDLIAERVPLYERYAHETLDTAGMTLDEVVQTLETVC